MAETYRIALQVSALIAAWLWGYATATIHADGQTWAEFLRAIPRLLLNEDPAVLRPWIRWVALLLRKHGGGRG